MNRFLLMGIAVLLLTGCETAKGTLQGASTGFSKDVTNTGTVVCKTGQTVADAFAEGDENKPRGAFYKADDWFRKNLW